MKNKSKRYECKCPTCGKVFYACKSIFQEGFGQNDMGHGSCPECNTFHNLTFDPEKEIMVATPMEVYRELRQLQKEKKQEIMKAREEFYGSHKSIEVDGDI